MKSSLQLKINQQTAMTPQLQQAIKLLQLSTLDLQQEIQKALDSNPLLELEEELAYPEAFDRDIESEKQFSPPSATKSIDSSHLADEHQTDSQWCEQIPMEMAIDANWEDTFQSASSASIYHNGQFESQETVQESLQGHLLWQLNLVSMSDVDRFIGISIIDAIDERGYLVQNLDELVQSINSNLATESEDAVEIDEVEAVRHHIQQFDPMGSGCWDLRECLLVQLRDLGPKIAQRDHAITLVRDHLELLGNHDYNLLQRRTGFCKPELQEILNLITTLTPYPGDAISSTTVPHLIPDVIVRKVNQIWRVELNPEIAPKICINQQYAVLSKVSNDKDNNFIKSHLQEARWFLKSLQSRNDTLLRVARCICKIQQGFLDSGEESMKPLILADIAEHIDMHESTVSRVTTQKYIHTPRGIFELKYFFSSHVGTANGGERSSIAIRAIIRKLIGAELPRKPLSDNKLTNLLGQQGIKIARRTIAKYREEMSIPPSNERKRLA